MYRTLVKKTIRKTLYSIPQSRKYIEELNTLREVNKYQKLRLNELEKIFSVDHPIVQPDFKEQIIKADWRNPPKEKTRGRSKPPLAINWIMPPMGATASGGHTDIFRSIAYLENQGHRCEVFFYDVGQESSLSKLKQAMSAYPPINAPIRYGVKNLSDSDVLLATHWHTAYPVYNFNGRANKYYYIQDFEPLFEASSSFSAIAENTYRLGLRGITLGEWLTDKLTADYGMNCDYISFGYEPKEYFLKGGKKTKSILFYARPSTPRRGFEMGILALELFHKEHPEYQIHLVGADLEAYQIPFPYVNHGIVGHERLNELYNQCVAGIVISFTNMSLLPLEMLAAGCVPVVNDGVSTHSVLYEKDVYYSEPSPRALADRLEEAINEFDIKKAQESALQLGNYTWDKSNDKLEKILLKDLC